MFQGVDLKKFIKYILIFNLFFIIFSCTKDIQFTKEDEFLILKKRVNEYWTYIIKGDIEKAYNLEHPKFREQTNIIKYINRYKVIKYENFEIIDIRMDSDIVEVDLEIIHKYLIKYFWKKDIKRKLIDRWAKFEGVWFHIPEGFNIKNL